MSSTKLIKIWKILSRMIVTQIKFESNLLTTSVTEEHKLFTEVGEKKFHIIVLSRASQTKRMAVGRQREHLSNRMLNNSVFCKRGSTEE